MPDFPTQHTTFRATVTFEVTALGLESAREQVACALRTAVLPDWSVVAIEPADNGDSVKSTERELLVTSSAYDIHATDDGKFVNTCHRCDVSRATSAEFDSMETAILAAGTHERLLHGD